jgi:hypothetical protein
VLDCVELQKQPKIEEKPACARTIKKDQNPKRKRGKKLINERQMKTEVVRIKPQKKEVFVPWQNIIIGAY